MIFLIQSITHFSSSFPGGFCRFSAKEMVCWIIREGCSRKTRSSRGELFSSNFFFSEIFTLQREQMAIFRFKAAHQTNYHTLLGWQIYLCTVLSLLQVVPNCELHFSRTSNFSKQTLCNLHGFFKKGIFETSKYNTG